MHKTLHQTITSQCFTIINAFCGLGHCYCHTHGVRLAFFGLGVHFQAIEVAIKEFFIAHEFNLLSCGGYLISGTIIALLCPATLIQMLASSLCPTGK